MKMNDHGGLHDEKGKVVGPAKTFLYRAKTKEFRTQCLIYTPAILSTLNHAPFPSVVTHL